MDYYRVACVLMTSLLTFVTSQEDIHLEYSVFEESGEELFIGDLASDSGLSDGFVYTIVEQRSEYSNLFMTRPPGSLFTTQSIDRESLTDCSRAEMCQLELIVSAKLDSFVEFVKVTVTIQDMNDNEPVFIPSTITIPLPENTAVGRSISIPAAVDPDSPVSSIKRYAMLTGAPEFSLNVHTNQDGTFELNVVLEEPLDYEKETHYPLTIAAYDGEASTNRGVLFVDVEVLDINDNSPVFTKDNYSANVSEDMPVDSVVVKVSATDLDQGLNGRIIYGFSDQTQRDLGGVFSINNRTGDISIISPLSYQDKEYVLVVTARNDLSSLAVSTKVTISVEDINDHAPGKWKDFCNSLFI